MPKVRKRPAAAAKRARKRTPEPDLSPDHLDDARLEWERNAQSGDTRAKATCNVLTALTWIRIYTSGEHGAEAAKALQDLETIAIKYLREIGRELEIRGVPFPLEKGRDFAKLAEHVEKWIDGCSNANKPSKAAQIFMIKAREYGVALPNLTVDDNEAMMALSLAVQSHRVKEFESDRARALAWTRVMLRAGGRTDADNAMKNAEYGWTKKDRGGQEVVPE